MSLELKGWWIWDSKLSWPPPDGSIRCFFRRRFNGDALGDDAALHISADSRYRAFLNGQVISRGPCRGTPQAYRFETVPLAGLVRPGENVLLVEVLWYGSRSAWGEIHLSPGLWAMIGPDGEGGHLVTDESWEVGRWNGPDDPAAAVRQTLPSLIVDPVETYAPPADLNEMMRWLDANGQAACKVEPAQGPYSRDLAMGYRHELAGREIPLLEETVVEPQGVLECGEITPSASPLDAWQINGELRPQGQLASAFWGEGAAALRFEAPGTHYVIVNMGRLVTARVRLELDVPAGSLVELRYSEALSRQRHKAVRDDPAAGTVEGYFDSYVRHEGGSCFIETFAWRTFRFLRIAVHHPGGAAVIRRMETVFTAYPFSMRGSFESSDPLHRQLWDISWRTARLCAHEHYEDCPYYEQLQYVGDTRLQALVSYLVAGDFRLARQSLRQFAHSRRYDGMLQSRFPLVAWMPQIIPNFALIWIEFLEDYYRYSGDLSLVRELLGHVGGVVDWFRPYDRDGLLWGVPYWVFTDWSFPVDSQRTAGSQGELNLRHVAALQSAARLAEAAGETSAARDYGRRARRAKQACRRQLRRREDGLFADEPDGTVIGEHASLLAILYDVVKVREGRALLRRLRQRPDLKRATIYYNYYAFRAYEKLGLWEEAYQERLHNWTDQLALHATTWFERPEPSRSDCHAWGSWIMCDLLTSILGVTPAEPGFARVRIAPKLLPHLTYARGTIPTVGGDIQVALERRGGKMVSCTVELPPGMSGVLVGGDGVERELSAGRTSVAWE